MTITTIIPGNPWTVPVVFTNPAGIPTDPTTATLRLENPTGQIMVYSYPGTIVRDSVGAFHQTINPPYPSGAWIARWDCAGALVASTGDIEYTVLPSVFP